MTSPVLERLEPLQRLGATIVVEGTRILQRSSDATPELLWHYTDTAGALGILERRALWATHALFMNDASELALAYPLLDAALADAPERHGHSAVVERISQRLGEVSERPEDPDVYAVSFCEDGDLLSQWRAYAVSGAGYSLGFDGAVMDGEAGSTFGLSLSRVVYDTDLQRELAVLLVDATIAAVTRFIEDESGDVDAAAAIGARAFSHLAHTFAYQIKDGAFREEREWRLIYTRYPQAAVPSAKRAFRPSARGLIPYVSIPLGADQRTMDRRLDPALDSFPLRAVRVGPTAHPEIAALAIRYLLADLGLDDTAVTSSEIPLRA